MSEDREGQEEQADAAPQGDAGSSAPGSAPDIEASPPMDVADEAPVLPPPPVDLDRSAILGKKDRALVREYVPEWNGFVYLRTMSGEQRDAFEVSCIVNGKQSYANVRGKLLVHVICNKDGDLLFTEAEAADLGKKSGAALGRLYNRATQLNAVTEADVDELVKNSGSGTTVSS
jgi:hypothetical protein